MSLQPDPVPEPPPPVVEPAPPTSDDRNLAVICHVGGLLTSILVPLVLWLMKKDQSRFLDLHGREALNFQITLIIYYTVAALSMILLIGLILLPALLIFEIVVVVQASMAASRGEPYHYPWNIHFIK